MKRGWLTAFTVTILFGAYRLYAALVGPYASVQIQGDRLLVPSPATEIRPLSIVGRVARTHLEDQLWAEQAKFQLQRGEETFIYFDSQRRVEDDKQNRIRVSPFAMVWIDPRQNAEVAYTLTCESAVIEFQSKVQFGMSSPGRIIGGTLEGAVEITGPDGLHVTGQNFLFREDALRLHSDWPVQFAYGPEPGGIERVRGRAGMLDIRLKQASKPVLGHDMPLVGGLRQVALRRNVVLDLVMDDDGAPAPVRLTCKTQFTYDIDQMLATFTDDVSVRRATHKDGEEPRFDVLENCDHLQLVFDKAVDADETMAGAPLQKTGGIVPVGEGELSEGEKLGIDLDLEFRSLRAIGRNLVLGSQENELAAETEEVFYDVPTRTVEMANANGDVVAQFRADLLTCPTLLLRHGAGDEIEAAECLGRGKVIRTDPSTGEVLLESSWDEFLLLQPDPESELDILEISGAGRVVQPPQQTGIIADSLKVWVDRDQIRSSDEPVTETVTGGGDLPVRKVLAVANVALVSPRLQLETQRLTVGFTTGRVRRADLESNEGEGGRKPGGNESEANQPVLITADSVATQLTYDPETGRTDVQQVDARDGVTISRTGADTQAEEDDAAGDPFSIEAESLELLNHNGGHILKLVGSPARIRHPEAEIEGGNLFFDRLGNLARVEGSGAVSFLVESDLEGRKLDVPQPLTVRWKDQMEFDGQLATFYGDVRTSLSASTMHCEQMDVSLDRRLTFARSEAETSGLQIDRVKCADGVVARYVEWDGTTLIGIRNLQVSQFQYERLSGEIRAQGPGQVEDWRRGGQRRRVRIDPASADFRKQGTDSDEHAWEYTRVRFAGHLRGNQLDRFVTLHDRVRVMHGPVANPLDTIDREEFARETSTARNSIWVGSDILQLRLVPGTGEAPDTVSVLAKGNAELQGKEMGARSDSISYDESKEMFTLKSRGTEAYLWHQERPGQPVRELSAKTIQFVPSKHQITVDGVRGIQGSP